MGQISHARAEHYMVEGAVCAEGWQTIAMIRRTMLRAQFACLPYKKDDEWYLVTDSALVRFCASGGARTSTLNSATSLQLVKATVVPPSVPVEELKRGNEGLVLVVDQGYLRGIIAPFDLL